ncbi:hypothetical protein AVEN_116260-1 [Araneus ventricosus]|uniref:Secreted protein n=1 Tax=Araneus ventricosus TaxID=182803 RepID=A0A4Y2VYH0_ARAVE|nr:hypothetical protein AVEN_116260-1 [Araneus ventricosus]
MIFFRPLILLTVLKSLMPQFQLHKILWVAVSSTVGLRIERRHHLQSVCLQDVVLVDQTDENRLGLSLVGQCYSIHAWPDLWQFI